MSSIKSPTPETFIAQRIAAHRAKSRRARSADSKAAKGHRQRRNDWKARIEALKDANYAARAFRKFERAALRDWHLWQPRVVKKTERAPPKGRIKRRQDHRPSRPTTVFKFDIIDRAGRRGIFLKIHYDGAIGNRFGVFGRRVVYAAQADEVMLGPDGVPLLISNVAANLNEAVVVADEIEAFNRSEAKNAKLSVNLIVGFPRGSTAKEQERIVRLVAQQVCGNRDLPYIAYIHRPVRAGEVHNPHAHITMSFRPVVRQGAYRYLMSKELRTDLDGPAGMLEMRRILAKVTTRVMREAGFNREYTHLSNCARGLALIPQESLTKGQTEAAKRGEHVAANERNRRRMLDSASWSWKQMQARIAEHSERVRSVAQKSILVAPKQLTDPASATLVAPLKPLVLPVIRRPLVPSRWAPVTCLEQPPEIVQRSLQMPSNHLVPVIKDPAKPATLNRVRQPLTRPLLAVAKPRSETLTRVERPRVWRAVDITKPKLEPINVACPITMRSIQLVKPRRALTPSVLALPLSPVRKQLTAIAAARSPSRWQVCATKPPVKLTVPTTMQPSVSGALSARQSSTPVTLTVSSPIAPVSRTLVKPRLGTVTQVRRPVQPIRPTLVSPSVRLAPTLDRPRIDLTSTPLRPLVRDYESARGDDLTVVTPPRALSSGVVGVVKPIPPAHPRLVTPILSTAGAMHVRHLEPAQSPVRHQPVAAMITHPSVSASRGSPDMDAGTSNQASPAWLPQPAPTNGTAVSAAKENTIPELSAGEIDRLMDRLERNCPPLEEKNGLVQPVDPRAFSEAELAWMQRDLLMMARLLLLQQQEDEAAQALKEEVRRKHEARRIAASLGPVGSPPPSSNANAAEAGQCSDREASATVASADAQHEAARHARSKGMEVNEARSPTPDPAGQMDDQARQAAAAALAAQRTQAR